MRAAVILLVAALGAGDGATEALRARADEIRAALPPAGKPMTPEIRKNVQAIVTRTVDLQAMLEASLGPRWKEITPKQRKQLQSAFETRFRQASGGDIEPYRSTQIDYLPEVPVAGGDVQVPTRVVVKGEPTEIAYTMRKEPAGWRIVDIVVDGVSTVANYRASFARVIQKDGVDGLIRKLEKSAAAESKT